MKKVMLGVVVCALMLVACQDRAGNGNDQKATTLGQSGTQPVQNDAITVSDALKTIDNNLAGATNKEDKIAFRPVPINYSLPQEVRSACKEEADGDKNEIACPIIDIKIASVEPKWIERALNIAITEDDNPELTKFRRHLDAFARQQLDDGALAYTWTIEPKYLGIHNRVAQFAVRHESYMGGAHGMHSQDYYLYDLDLGSRISFYDDILIHDSEEGAQLPKLGEQAFDLYLADQGLSATEIADHKRTWAFDITENVYFDKEGMVLSYAPYELGPYVMGEIELVLPYEQLQGAIRGEYLPKTKS